MIGIVEKPEVIAVSKLIKTGLAVKLFYSNSGIYMFYSKTTVKLFVCITGILLELFDILL